MTRGILRQGVILAICFSSAFGASEPTTTNATVTRQYAALAWFGYDGRDESDPDAASYILNGTVMGKGDEGFVTALDAIAELPSGCELLVCPDESIRWRFAIAPRSGESLIRSVEEPVPFRHSPELVQRLEQVAQDRKITISYHPYGLPAKYVRELGWQHTPGTFGLAVSPLGRIVASGSSNSELEIRQVSSELRKRVDCGAGEIWSLAFSPDEGRLVVGANDCIALVDVPELEILWRNDHKALRREVAFSDDGQLVACVRDGGGRSLDSQYVQIYRAADGSLYTQLRADKRGLSYVAFLKGSHRIVASGRSLTYVWDIDKATPVLKHAVDGGGGFALSPDKTTAAVGA